MLGATLDCRDSSKDASAPSARVGIVLGRQATAGYCSPPFQSLSIIALVALSQPQSETVKWKIPDMDSSYVK